MATQGQRAGNLPAEQAELVGRRAELYQVRRLLEGARLVSVTGVGGVGKTRLALRAAHLAQSRFRDGVWWVELSGLRHGELLTAAIAEALPVTDRTTRPMSEVLAEYLAPRELLLVLDTCEHLATECREVAATLLTMAPGLRILTTSRRTLGAAAERLVTLAPLPLPEGDSVVDWQADATVLLAARAAEAVPGFTVTDAERPDLVRLCRRLEGLPLALELAAARLREMTPAELTERLDDRFGVLESGDAMVRGTVPAWHEALRTTIGWSHELCTPAERLLWARLSVFAGGLDAETAGAVCGDEILPREAIADLLTALADKSLLTSAPGGGPGARYRMLDTIREFGAHWLHDLGEEAQMRRRHRDHYLGLAQRADAAWMGPDQLAWHARMTDEHANLRAALDLCLAERDGHTAQEMAGVLWFFWAACGHARDGRDYLDRALALDETPGPVRAKALWACGLVTLIQGDADTGLHLAALLREAVAEDTDETASLAAINLESTALVASGLQEQAAALLAKTPASPPASGRYRAAWFMARGTQALVHIHLRQFAEATDVADELCDECTRVQETWSRAWGNYMRALASLRRGRAEEAAYHARAALDGKRRLDDSLGTGMVIDLLAYATLTAGYAEPAARFLGIAERIWRTLGTPQAGMPELVTSRAMCEQHARSLIGDATYQTAFDTGYDTDPDTGIAYALDPHAATTWYQR
ncbi:ATP-binding protein [Streptomyces sp. NPDC050400]|uniref:ATP-binding protein n=1 Tax=Streptomyces sp. NPDC050400 TaxID=3365610 RepID=UPI0037A4D699